MENASKALFIAASVFISIFILAVGMYLYTNYSEISYNYEKNKADQALIEYNMKFEKYVDKEQLTIQDILTIVNLAKDYNERKSDNEITVYLNSSSGGEQNLLEKGNKWWIDSLKASDELSSNEARYKYKIEPDGIKKYDDGTIKEIYIKEK